MTDHFTVPIIRIELQGMKQTLVAYINETQLKMDSMVKEMVEKTVTPEYVGALVADQVDKALKEVISAEVMNFYRYGAGREAIRMAINNRLEEDLIFKEEYYKLKKCRICGIEGAAEDMVFTGTLWDGRKIYACSEKCAKVFNPIAT